MVVLDTCALIELIKTKPKLTKKTIDTIKKGAFILSVSFAEISCKTKLEKLYLDLGTLDLFYHFKKIPDIHIIDIHTELWIKAINQDWQTNKDPADRLITAYAAGHDIPIVTSDQKIKRHYKNVIW